MPVPTQSARRRDVATPSFCLVCGILLSPKKTQGPVTIECRLSCGRGAERETAIPRQSAIDTCIDRELKEARTGTRRANARFTYYYDPYSLHIFVTAYYDPYSLQL